MNVEPKQIIKKVSLISKTKKESSRNEKTMGKFGETRKNVRSKIKVTLGIKKLEVIVQNWLVFLEKNLAIANLDQNLDFRSEN